MHHDVFHVLNTACFVYAQIISTERLRHKLCPESFLPPCNLSRRDSLRHRKPRLEAFGAHNDAQIVGDLVGTTYGSFIRDCGPDRRVFVEAYPRPILLPSAQQGFLTLEFVPGFLCLWSL